jgi:hypothetical protein
MLGWSLCIIVGGILGVTMASLGKIDRSGTDSSGAAIQDIQQVWQDKEQFYSKAGCYWEVCRVLADSLACVPLF